jgi:hypothetical protein
MHLSTDADDVSVQLLHALAALDVPEALHGAPKTAAELAPLVGEHAPTPSLSCTALVTQRT